MLNARQDGYAFDWINTTTETVNSGEFVHVGGSLGGMAVADIAPGELGALTTQGVYIVPAVTTEAIAAGATLNWDAATKMMTATGAGTASAMAIAWHAKSMTEATVQAYLRTGGFSAGAATPTPTPGATRYSELLTVGADGQTVFVLARTPTNPTELQLFLRRLQRRNGVDYSIAGNTITLTMPDVAIYAGDQLSIYYE